MASVSVLTIQSTHVLDVDMFNIQEKVDFTNLSSSGFPVRVAAAPDHDGVRPHTPGG